MQQNEIKAKQNKRKQPREWKTMDEAQHGKESSNLKSTQRMCMDFRASTSPTQTDAGFIREEMGDLTALSEGGEG